MSYHTTWKNDKINPKYVRNNPSNEVEVAFAEREADNAAEEFLSKFKNEESFKELLAIALANKVLKNKKNA